MFSHGEQTITQKKGKKITNVAQYGNFFFLQQSVSVGRNASVPVGQLFVAVLMELLIIEEQGLIEKINISWICNEGHVEQQAC